MNKGLKGCRKLKSDNLLNDVDGVFIEPNLRKVKWLFLFFLGFFNFSC